MLVGKVFIPLDIKIYGSHLEKYFQLSYVHIVAEQNGVLAARTRHYGQRYDGPWHWTIPAFERVVDIHNLVEE